jgi:DNA-binding NarL/FixJ family response regulator
MSGAHGLKVLLIDDSKVVRRILRRLLKKDARVGHLFVASNAADGYSLFKIARPDVVVLDLALPDLHGLDILKLIKRATPRCVVIVLTNCTAPEMRQECLRHGADSFLNKESDLITVPGAIPMLYEIARTRSQPERNKRATEERSRQLL